jgi:hypothetical protein
LNLDPPDLCLLYSADYRREPLAPSSHLCLPHEILFCEILLYYVKIYYIFFYYQRQENFNNSPQDVDLRSQKCYPKISTELPVMYPKEVTDELLKKPWK